LRLKKEGYVDYENKIRATQNPTTLKATMMPVTEPAYISIKVINGGANPIVEINGRILAEKVPIENYRVPSNTPLKIFAKNPFTQLTDEVKVVIQPNQRKNIELILGRAQSRKK
jgi:hypothetical protein